MEGLKKMTIGHENMQENPLRASHARAIPANGRYSASVLSTVDASHSSMASTPSMVDTASSSMASTPSMVDTVSSSMASTPSMVEPLRFSIRSMASMASMVVLVVLFVVPTVAGAQPSGPMSVPPPGLAASEQIPILREVGIDQKLDGSIPLDLEFSDEEGRTVRLGDFFGRRPVVLALVYYECPMLCTQVLNGLVGSLEALSFNPGGEFEVVVLSFDPGETPAIAADKRTTYLRRYGRPGHEAGWHFLTGREAPIKALADAVGFRYAYDEAIDQYAHPAAITVLTGDGRVSKYLYGIEFAPRDLRLALVEAAEGRIGTAVDQALLFCYHYDPETGTYGLVVMNLIRTGGVLTLVGLVAFILLALRRERRAAQHANG